MSKQNNNGNSNINSRKTNNNNNSSIIWTIYVQVTKYTLMYKSLKRGTDNPENLERCTYSVFSALRLLNTQTEANQNDNL